MAKTTKTEAHLRRIIGQLQGVEKMIKNGKECEQIIIQIMAARSSLEQLGITMLKDEACKCFNMNCAEKKLKKFEKITNNLFKLT